MHRIARHALVVALMSCLGVAAEAQEAQLVVARAGTFQNGASAQSPLRQSLARAIDMNGSAATQGGSRHDSLLNGVLIGAAAGGLLGLIPDHYDDCEECHDSLYASIAVGAGIGLLVDALRTRAPTAQPSSTIRPSVIVGRRGVGIRAAVRWGDTPSWCRDSSCR